MTTNRKNNKVEAEIERHRSLFNWDKALEITRTQWTKSNNGLGRNLLAKTFKNNNINNIQ